MIHWEIQEGVGVIKFDSPRGNMLGIDDLRHLDFLLSERPSDIRALVLTGENRSFCAGVTVDETNPALSFRLLDEVLLKLYSLDIPLVVALSGHAIGAGFLMLCCADYAVSTDNERMKFGLPEINIGLGLDEMMLCLVSGSLPDSTVKKLLYSGY